ncbi:MAG TPA: outer membrane lipoprotein-sorting protein [Bacteroidales bacterium]|nr:outer membrane lipoprotein-sorting protein [Bacteroidales bacterium]
MKKMISSLAMILFIGSFAVQAQNLNKILDDYYDAVGMKKLLNTTTIVMKGNIVQMNMDLPMTMYRKRPNKMRMEAVIQGNKFVQAYNGKDGWAIMPWTGSTDPQPLTDDQVKLLEQEADIEGDLYNWKEKGFEVTLEGSDEMEGTPVYKIKVVKPSGNEYTYYLDKDNNVVLREDARVKVQGTPIESATYYSNFKSVDGMIMPFSIESKMNGQVTSQITIDSVEVNQDIDDSMFDMPEATK